MHEAIASVTAQTYQNLEVIVVDDGSTDTTNLRIVLNLFPPFQSHGNVKSKSLLTHKKALGICSAFNRALSKAHGKYVIDFAADDVMHPERIANQVTFFEAQPEQVGVIYHNAEYINAAGKSLGLHYKKTPRVPHTGNIRARLLRPGGYICTPTIMMRRTVLEMLGGYNEELSYEDYDFFMRSSQHFFYAYQDEVLTQKRRLTNSHGAGFYRKKENPHLESTFKVLKAAQSTLRNKAEYTAWKVSVRYHLRQALLLGIPKLARAFAALLHTKERWFWYCLSRLRLHILPWRKIKKLLP